MWNTLNKEEEEEEKERKKEKERQINIPGSDKTPIVSSDSF